MRSGASSSLLLVCLLLGPAARAGPFEDHYLRAELCYKDRRYDEALAELRMAYRIHPAPRLLYNIAMAHLRLGNAAEALAMFDRYRTEDPTLTPADRALVERHAEEARALLAAPGEAPVNVPAPAPAPAPAKVARRASAPWPALGVAISGVAILAAGLGSGGAAMQAAGDVVSTTAFDPDLYQRGQSLNTAAITLDVVGGAALAAGVIWTAVWYARRRTGHSPVSVGPLAPGGPGLVPLGRF